MADDGKADPVKFDVKVGDKVIGQSFDRNPVVYESDTECRAAIVVLQKDLTLSKKETKVLKNCLTVVDAEDGDDIPFGPEEIMGLANLAMKHPSRTHEIMAISHHLCHSADMEGELPTDIFLDMAKLHGQMGDLIHQKQINAEDDDSDDDDEEEEEEEEESEEEDEDGKTLTREEFVALTGISADMAKIVLPKE
jgi:hypothetical protein